MAEKKRQVKIKFPEHLHGGVYANNMSVTHSKEEFMLDFFVVAPPAGTVTARVITSPGHVKRMISVLQDSIKKYEKMFGRITESGGPKGGLEFKPPTVN